MTIPPPDQRAPDDPRLGQPAPTADPRPAHLPPPPRSERGLTSEEAAERLARYGPNRLVPERRRGGLAVWLLRPLTDPMALLLLVAAPTYLLIGDTADAAVTFAALVPIAAVGWVLEARAERALEQLRRLTAPTVTVWRDDGYQVVAAEELVPDDLIVLHEGDIVPADGVLVEATQMMVDESALTGESLPVAKAAHGESRDLLAGTTILSGRGIGRVTVTGGATQYGRIGALVAQIRQPSTPLQRLVGRLVRTLGAVAAVFCLAVVGVELARGQGLGAAVIAGVSLAIAAIPEEFPMVYTLYLALGAWRLAREQALVRRLTGVETLGSTTVICSDKTGTLTLGHLEVAELATVNTLAAAGKRAAGALPSAEPVLADALLDGEAQALVEAAVLASEPRPFDPMERALLRYARARGVDPEALHAGALVADNAFDPHHKYLSHVWRHDGRYAVCAKGSVEGILERSAAAPGLRRQALEANRALAAQGMRVIAVASGELSVPSGDRDVDEAALEFRGLVGFSDPVRPGVIRALEQCRAAGIRVIMMTGDHPATAHAVAESLGLPHTNEKGDDAVATGAELDTADDAALAALVSNTNIFARTRPEQKHRLVRALRAGGHIVAMTGDGINDAPALREADIGVAMGQRGTEVARESATMVLLDDNFATIVGAVRNGRRIFENLRRAFAYLVAFHPPLLVAAFVIPLLGQPLLLMPIHLVLLELIVHPTVSLVFENDPPAADTMARPPRPPGSGLIGRDLILPFALGLCLSVAVVGAYLVALGQAISTEQARALGFAVLLTGQALLVLVVRSPQRPVWRTELRANRTVVPVVTLTIAALLAFIYLPPLAGALRLAPFPPAWWLPVAAVAAIATLAFEPLKLVRSRR